jgi:hypothetical protein
MKPLYMGSKAVTRAAVNANFVLGSKRIEILPMRRMEKKYPRI